MPSNQKPVFQRLAATPPRYPVLSGVLDHDSYLLKGEWTRRQKPPRVMFALLRRGRRAIPQLDVNEETEKN